VLDFVGEEKHKIKVLLKNLTPYSTKQNNDDNCTGQRCAADKAMCV
jgi:hypothetical protein